MTTDFPSNNNIRSNANGVNRKHPKKDDKKSGANENQQPEAGQAKRQHNPAISPDQVYSTLNSAAAGKAMDIQKAAGIATSITSMNKVLKQFESTIREEFPGMSPGAVEELALRAMNRHLDRQSSM